MSRSLSVDIAGMNLKNPIVTASGTFGSGKEYNEFFPVGILGGVTVKGVSITPWSGNKPPRIAETYGGMLNAVGLQNPGIYKFIEEDIPFLRQFDTKIIVNLCGHTLEEYVEVAKVAAAADCDALELNISCPNVSEGGIAFGTDCKMAGTVTEAVKKAIAGTSKPLIVKLSPNVADVTAVAKSVVAAGADALSLINTLIGMKIDIYKRRPILANKRGGLSGPAIKPVAIRMVYDVSRAVNVPIIGMGGVSTWEDAVEMMMAGAAAVAVGTAHFNNPFASVEILAGIEKYMDEHGVKDIRDIIGVSE